MLMNIFFKSAKFAKSAGYFFIVLLRNKAYKIYRSRLVLVE